VTEGRGAALRSSGEQVPKKRTSKRKRERSFRKINLCPDPRGLGQESRKAGGKWGTRRDTGGKGFTLEKGMRFGEGGSGRDRSGTIEGALSEKRGGKI